MVRVGCVLSECLAGCVEITSFYLFMYLFLNNLLFVLYIRARARVCVCVK